VSGRAADLALLPADNPVLLSGRSAQCGCVGLLVDPEHTVTRPGSGTSHHPTRRSRSSSTPSSGSASAIPSRAATDAGQPQPASRPLLRASRAAGRRLGRRPARRAVPAGGRRRPPPWPIRAALLVGLKTRARVLRLLPPQPERAPTDAVRYGSRTSALYPDGYEISELGPR
jgi:hypothetical protein